VIAVSLEDDSSDIVYLGSVIDGQLFDVQIDFTPVVIRQDEGDLGSV
jgi:hypothetical protein